MQLIKLLQTYLVPSLGVIFATAKICAIAFAISFAFFVAFTIIVKCILPSELNFLEIMNYVLAKARLDQIKETILNHNTNQKISDILEKGPNISDISEIFNSLLDNYRDFLTTLDSEQLVAIINFWGFYMVWTAITSITFVTLGDIIIEKLNLEVRFPKLANYIKLQKKLRKAYLYINILFLYIIVVAFILGNIYIIFIQ